MSNQKWGGVAAIIQACIYVFGFILFFIVLETASYGEPSALLHYTLLNRDRFYAGYIVIGIVFSFALIVLAQALHQRLQHNAKQLMDFATLNAYLWSGFVLSSTFIYLTGIEVIASIYEVDEDSALTIFQSTSIIVDALGGGIELLGAVWVMLVSYVGIKLNVYHRLIHFWGLGVGAAGILTLLKGFTFSSSNIMFEAASAIFGLGQILWFIGLGSAMLMDTSEA